MKQFSRFELLFFCPKSNNFKETLQYLALVYNCIVFLFTIKLFGMCAQMSVMRVKGRTFLKYMY